MLSSRVDSDLAIEQDRAIVKPHITQDRIVMQGQLEYLADPTWVGQKSRFLDGHHKHWA
jgi:hypothetical protein